MVFMKMKNSFQLLFCFLLLLCVTPHCGNKGPPIIPQLIVPQTPSDINVTMECRRIAITFLPPQLNNDGSVVENLESVQIYRKRLKAKIPETDANSKEKERLDLDSLIGNDTQGMEDQLDENDQRDSNQISGLNNRGTSFKEKVDSPFTNLIWLPVDKKFKRIAEYNIKTLRNLENPDYMAPDLYPEGFAPIRCYDGDEKQEQSFQHDQDYIYQYQYRLRVENEDGDYSPFSKVASVYYTLPAQPPQDILWTQEQATIKIQWDPPVFFCNGSDLDKKFFFNIFLREKLKAYTAKPLNKNPIDRSFYILENINYDSTYYCVVTTVTTGPYCESIFSKEMEIVLKDLIPPDPPHGLIAIGGYNLVSLLWESPKNRDILGYNIYRKSAETEQWQKINDDVSNRTTYVDRTVDMTRTYFYTVTCLDNSPQQNESLYSNTQKVVFK